MSNPTLVAQTRSEFGKGAARRARRAGLVPGGLYGHGGDPVHVDLPAHELFLAVARRMLCSSWSSRARSSLLW